MKKKQRLLSEIQWKTLEPLFPEPKRRKDGCGRPWPSNRECLEDNLWVLRTGARWRNLPEEFPDGSTLLAPVAELGRAKRLPEGVAKLLSMLH